MDQYNISEVIGRGKCSTVWKGRKKKTIEYYAIKRVEKSQKSKTVQEVKILQTLQHQNVVKFYSWYETSAHLWLVLEYCIGGSLRTLLDQDRQLSEEPIHDRGWDLVRALLFLHSKGIIYCDLKPSNILLDENGGTKLCDFGLARTLRDISQASSSSLPQAKRGTPSYMAPELFEDRGVQSYVSDFWALGCILYECYAGRPPFVGRELTQLVKSIRSDPIPPLPGTPSGPFVNLINSLLIKDPAERIQWPELCGHAFWRTKLNSVPLPPQPAFTIMLEQYAKPSSIRNGDKTSENRTPKSGQKDVKGASKQDENSIVGSKGHGTPLMGTPGSQKIQANVSGRGGDEKQKDVKPLSIKNGDISSENGTPNSCRKDVMGASKQDENHSGTTRSVNLLRHSRIATQNLQRENEKDNYGRVVSNHSENDSEVKIENTDMKLDQNENTEDDSLDEKSSSQNQQQAKAEEMENNINHSDTPPVVNASASNESTICDQESPQNIEVAATPCSVSPQIKNQRYKKGSGSEDDCDSAKSSTNLLEVFWHPSDLSVRPVMPSREADKTSEVIPSLPFEALQASDFVKLSTEKLDALTNKIISIFNGNISIGEKRNAMRYLEMLTNNADAANILTNGPIMLILVEMLRDTKALALRVQVASLIGLLIRHSTFIHDNLANSELLGSLTDGLGDQEENVRRFSMAALGELLFYISTKSDDAGDNNPVESPTKECRFASRWQVPKLLLSKVVSILRKGEDDITQLYALRTIANICSQAGHWAAHFNRQGVIRKLCDICTDTGKHESIRLAAGLCLVRLVRFNPPSIQGVIVNFPLQKIACAIVKGSPKSQQISLNLLNMALLGSHTFTNYGMYLLPLMQDKNIVPSLVSLIERGSEVLKGKALVFVALLCKNCSSMSGRNWLPHFFCSSRLLSMVDRLTKEKCQYVSQCLDAFVRVVASVIPGLLETITGDIQQMMGSLHGHLSPLKSRAFPKTTNIEMLPIVLHLLQSSSFKHMVVSDQVLQQLANLIKIVKTPIQGRDDFQNTLLQTCQKTLLQILESVAEESPVILKSPIFTSEVLPSLAVLYKGNKDGDARDLCFKMLFDTMVIFLNEQYEDEQRSKELQSIVNRNFLPLYPSLIEDEDPIPFCAQNLLVMLTDYKYIKITEILHPKIASQCFEYLLGDLSRANVKSVMLCLALTSAREMETKLLSRLRAVKKIGNLLEFAYAKNLVDFLEPTLGLCKAFLLRSVTSIIGFTYSAEPTLLGDASFEPSGGQQQGIQDIMGFGSNVGLFLELSKSREGNVADVSSECVVLLLKAAPREGTVGLLTNLPKVTAMLKSWRTDTSHLLLQRVLHALGYACRQYLLHTVILSISLPEIPRIERIVSELKISDVPALATAAFHVAVELQRLRLCK